MGIAKTYDKVQWHFPEGKGCPDLSTAKIHFQVVFKWLKEKGLLSAEGLELFDLGIDSDFAITGHMLTSTGNLVLEKCYNKWVKSIEYGTKPNTSILDDCLKKL